MALFKDPQFLTQFINCQLHTICSLDLKLAVSHRPRRIRYETNVISKIWKAAKKIGERITLRFRNVYQLSHVCLNGRESRFALHVSKRMKHISVYFPSHSGMQNTLDASRDSFKHLGGSVRIRFEEFQIDFACPLTLGAPMPSLSECNREGNNDGQKGCDRGGPGGPIAHLKAKTCKGGTSAFGLINRKHVNLLTGDARSYLSLLAVSA